MQHSHKFAIVWESFEQINKSGTHRGPRFGSPVTDMAFVAHFPYQSEQHWEAKKVRGEPEGGNRWAAMPERYNEVEELRGWTMLRERIAGVADTDLRACLADMF